MENLELMQERYDSLKRWAALSCSNADVMKYSLLCYSDMEQPLLSYVQIAGIVPKIFDKTIFVDKW